MLQDFVVEQDKVGRNAILNEWVNRLFTHVTRQVGKNTSLKHPFANEYLLLLIKSVKK